MVRTRLQASRKRPSRTPAARSAYQQRRLKVDRIDTGVECNFRELVRVLYARHPTVPKKEVSTLITIRKRIRDKRFKTYPEEWTPVERKLRGKGKPYRIEDVGSGFKTLAEMAKEMYPDALIVTLDIDGRTDPTHVCDYLNPSTYRALPRPSLTITR